MDGNLQQKRDVHWLLWLGIPLATLALKFTLPLVDVQLWRAIWLDELGFVETATAVMLIPAIVASVLIFRRRKQLPAGVGLVVLLLGFASLYFAGEEVSWGQHYFGWSSAEIFLQINSQHETNLHNTLGDLGGNLLNNLPRQILNVTMVAAIVSVIAIPLLRRRFDSRPGGSRWLRRFIRRCSDPACLQYWLMPTWRVGLAASMGLALRWAQKLGKWAGVDKYGNYVGRALMQEAGEFLEYCFALAIVLYVLSIYIRTQQHIDAYERTSLPAVN